LAVLFWLKSQKPDLTGRVISESPSTRESVGAARLQPRAFLVLAWVANPFAYVAMNGAVPVIPQLAARLHLTTMQAGFFCSIWFFARLAAFMALWRWTGWHYRFRWLVAAFILMIVSFAAMMLVPRLEVIVLAQISFGLAVGLIYYSSLFYSMDVGDTKGEHGGMHEALIGGGVFAGAAIGSAGQYMLGGQSGSTWAVSVVLMAGLSALVAVRRRLARSVDPARGSDFS
jgi:predicted MFS family arabinose efflux permease